MAQRFQALRCCFCKTYQVQQVKKSKKWNCKLCGEKQSVLKVYGQGSGTDCRQHVQKLNMLQGERMQAMEAAVWSIEEPTDSNDDCDSRRVSPASEQAERPASSRWSVYLDQRPVEEASEEQGGDGEIVYTDRQQFQADRRNASRDRSKCKRGLHNESRLLDPYGLCTEGDGKESARKKMRNYLKYVNTTPSESSGGNPEIGDTPRSDVLSQSQLESNPAARLGEESQHSTATFRAKRLSVQASRWDRFLPHGSAEDAEFFDQDSVSCGPEVHPTWERDSPPTDQPSARSVLEDRGDYAGDSALSAGFALAGDGWPSAPPNTGRVTEGMVSSAELAGDAHGPSSCARGAATDVPAQEPCPASALGAARDPRTPKLGPPPTLTPRQHTAGGPPGAAPGLHTKRPSTFLSLFQTDEDFDDL